MPVCRTCKVDKPREAFYYRKDTGKERAECNVCKIDRNTCRIMGISLSELLRLEYLADGKCQCCGKGADEHLSRLSLDHVHNTGEVRGFLCTGCNSALGHAADDPARLRQMADYLEGARPFQRKVIDKE